MMGAAETGERERLIERHLPLVRRLARRFAYRGVELEDLVQVGSIGLINAVDRFDRSRGCSLVAYAVPSIVGEIKRHLRDAGCVIRLPRRIQEERQEVRRAERELTGLLGRAPTTAEMAVRVGLTFDEVELALASDHARTPFSLVDGEAGAAAWDFREASETRVAVDVAFRALSERERRVLERRFFDDLSQEDIASEIGISQVHVSRTIRSALERLREELDDRGVVSSRHAS
jgi:RNA polymerase sigma-B factor